MPKATPQDVKYLGFDCDMFSPVVGSEPEFLTMVQSILDANVSEVKEAIGSSAYDSASNLADVKRIEAYLSAAELWERRGNISLKNRIIGKSENALLNMTESVKADEYRARARSVIDRLTGRTDIAISVEESSHFPQDK